VRKEWIKMKDELDAERKTVAELKVGRERGLGRGAIKGSMNDFGPPEIIFAVEPS
jgi:hypothetical protein